MTAGTASPAVPLIVMGVSGSGKSTIGQALGEAFGVPFVDGDALHPEANTRKMAAGTPLDDDDRWPWLDAIAACISAELAEGRPIVVACSALKRAYRDRLAAGAPTAVFVHLEGDRDLVAERQRGRTHEFMPMSLLGSQFEILEPLQAGERGIRVDVRKAPEAIVAEVARELGAFTGEARR